MIAASSGQGSDHELVGLSTRRLRVPSPVNMVQVEQQDERVRGAGDEALSAGGPSGAGMEAGQWVAAGSGQAAAEEAAVYGPADGG